jgi:hypothetical protein
MIFAGVDFSINSACVCISNGGEYIWAHFGREKTKYFSFQGEYFKQFLSPKRITGKSYMENERMKMQDARQLCLKILDFLKSHGVSHVAFEGHSFNSKGNSLLELVAYQFLLREMCLREIPMVIDNMFFYPPITVKAFAGGAKFKKKDLLEAFLKSQSESLKDNHIYKTISSNIDIIIKGEDVMKPIDDMIDSFWVVKKLETDV